jgi:aspartyl-tRNA(Asn)/glutamyl-tRNA(Gln) amidotransferase subunit A
MAKSVSDLALAMNILAGHDPRDPATPKVPIPNYSQALAKDLEGIRLGVPDRYYFDRLDEEVHTAVKKAIRDLKGLGAKVQPISIPYLHQASTAAFIALVAEGAAVLEKWHLTRSRDLGEDVRSRLNLGATIKATQYLKAQRVRGKVREIFMEAFKKVDALVTPQLPITAPKIGQSNVSWGKETESVVGALTRFTRIYNLIGIPSLCLPCGFSFSGMPIGLQIAAKPFAEETVLKVGHAYEINTPWKNRHPLLE